MRYRPLRHNSEFGRVYARGKAYVDHALVLYVLKTRSKQTRVGLTATKNDITANPKNIEIVEMEAAQLPRTLSDVDMAVINGNYATQAGFSSASDALAAESADSEAAQIYPNVLVVKEGRESDPAILALAAALQSGAVRDFINETYGGAVVPLF